MRAISSVREVESNISISEMKLVEKVDFEVHDVYKTLDRYDPELAEAVASLRKAAISYDALPPKYRELIIAANEVATGRGEKGTSHARKAVRAVPV